MLKKFISVLLACFTLTAVLPTGYAQEPEKTDALFEEAFPFLMNLGIIYDEYQEYSMTHYYNSISAEELATVKDGFYPNMPVSRAEFMMFSTKLVGVKDEELDSVSGESKFIDVDPENWAAKYINYAQSHGWINGTGNGMFNPERTILFSHALKIVMNILGYSNACELSGGFPNGYITTAMGIGLLDGISCAPESELNKREMAKLFYNALFTNVLQVKTVSGDIASMETVEGENLLYKKYNIKKGEGVVTANQYTSLVNVSGVYEGVEIDKVRYKTELEGTDDYLGQKVEFYYRDDNGEGTVIFIKPKSKKIITVKADDILGSLGEFGLRRFIYLDESENTKSMAISDMADFIINGKAEAKVTKSDLAPELGDVKLIDNDGDARADVVFVNSYINVIIGSVDSERGIIYDIDDASRNITADPYGNDDVIITKNGVKAVLTELNKYDVVAYYESRNEEGNKLKRIAVISKTKAGQITAAGEDEISIGGEKFEVSKDYRAELSRLRLKYEGTFYFDIDGKVCYNEPAKSDNGYGIILNTVFDDEDEEILKLKMFKPDETVADVTVAKKVRINNITYEKRSEIISELTSSGFYAGYPTQLVKYQTDSYGQINKIYTVKSNDPEEGLKRSFEKGSKRYRPGAKTFDGKFVMTNDTLVVKMPTLTGDDDLSFKDKESYSVIANTSFENYEPYTVEAYNVHDALIADVVLVYGDVAAEQISRKSNIALVEKIGEKLNEDDETVWYLSMWTNGSKVEKVISAEPEQFTVGEAVAEYYHSVIGKDIYDETVITDPDAVKKAISLIKKGDIIRFGVNVKDEISRLAVDMSLSRQKSFIALTQYHDPLRLFFGGVYDYKDGIVALATDTKNYSDAEAYNASSANVLIYDRVKDKIERGSVKDLESCLYRYNPSIGVMVRSLEGTTRDVIIVKDR